MLTSCDRVNGFGERCRCRIRMLARRAATLWGTKAERQMLERSKGANKTRRGSKTKVRMRVRPDALATEEPMEIRLISGAAKQTVAVTMRTPGADFELAAGFLYGEGIVSSPEDILKISYCVSEDLDVEQQYNIVNVELRGDRSYDLRSLERHLRHERLRRVRQGEPRATRATWLPRNTAGTRSCTGGGLRAPRQAQRRTGALRRDGRAARGGALRR